MLFFNKFSIQNHIKVTLTIIFLFLVIIILTSQYRSAVTKDVNNIFTETIKIKSLLYKLERDQYNFKSYENEQFMDSFKNHYHKIILNVDNLKGKFQRFENNAKTIRFLKQHLIEYGKGFLDFVKWRMNIYSTGGLMYNLDSAKVSFLKLTKANKKFYLDSMFLSLEITVKNFLISYNLKFNKSFTTQYKKLKRNILYEKGLNQEQRENLVLYLDKYQKNFSKIMVAFTTVGTSLNIGIIGDMQVEMKKSQSYIDTLIKNAEKLRTKKLRKIEDAILITNIILAILILLMLFLIFRKTLNTAHFLDIATKNLKINESNHIEINGRYVFQNCIRNLNNFFDNQAKLLFQFKNQNENATNLIQKIDINIHKNKTNIRTIYKNLSSGEKLLSDLEIILPKILSNIKNQNTKNVSAKNSIQSEIQRIIQLQYHITRYEEETNQILSEFKEFNNYLISRNQENITSLEKIFESLKLLSVNSAIESSKVGKDGENISIIADSIRQIEKMISLNVLALQNSNTEQIKLLNNFQRNIEYRSIPISEIKLNLPQIEQNLKSIRSRLESSVNSAKLSEQNINSILEMSKINFSEIRNAFELSQDSIEHTDNSNLVIIQFRELYGLGKNLKVNNHIKLNAEQTK